MVAALYLGCDKPGYSLSGIMYIARHPYKGINMLHFFLKLLCLHIPSNPVPSCMEIELIIIII